MYTTWFHSGDCIVICEEIIMIEFIGNKDFLVEFFKTVVAIEEPDCNIPCKECEYQICFYEFTKYTLMDRALKEVLYFKLCI